MIITIGNLAGAERFLFELVYDLSTAIHRETVELNAKEFYTKLSAIYELVKLSLNELQESEREASKTVHNLHNRFHDKDEEVNS